MRFSAFSCIILATITPALCLFDDPYIVCFGEVPDEPTYGVWPDFFGPNDYPSNMDLCSDAYGRRTPPPARTTSLNVGCRCAGAGLPVQCSSTVGNTLLYNWPLNDGMTFPNWCTSHCRCTTQTVSAGYWETDNEGSVVAPNDKRHEPSGGVLPYDARLYEPDLMANESLSDDGSEMGGLEGMIGFCGGTCTDANDCSDAGTSCTCRINSTTVLPGNTGTISGMSIFHGSICSQGFSLNGKREASTATTAPCVCNISYISHGCCSSILGMVWEEAEMKLGELYVENDLR